MKLILKYIPAAGLFLLLGGYLYYSIRADWSLPAQIMVYAGGSLLVFSLFWNWEDVQKRLHRRSVRYGSTAGGMVLALAGILGLVNFLSSRHSKRFDLTENQLFSLSEQSRKVTQNLKQDVQVTAFLNKTGATPFTDLMDQYRAVSKRVHYEVVDPQLDPGKARELGVQKFGDVVVQSGAKKERIETSTEEAITNSLIKVTREKNKSVYYVVGHGERDVNSEDGAGFSQARQKLQNQNYEIKELMLATQKTVPEDAAVVLSLGPRSEFLPPEVEALESYVNKAGKVLLLVDPPQQNGKDVKQSLDPFLKPKGIELDEDTVLDVSGIGQLFGMGPAAPLVTQYEGHPITEGLERTMTVFPLTRSLSTPAASEQGFSAQPLLKTNQNSWGETADLKGAAKFDKGTDKEGPLTIGMVSSKTIDGARQARIVVIGDSDFASNAYFERQRNGDLFLNTVSWLAEDTDLMAIRPRNPESRRISLTVPEANFLFYFAVILMPGVALMSGIAVWWNRRG